MRGRSLIVVAALVVLGAIGFEVAARAQDQVSRLKRTKKPTQVDIVQSIPLDVTVSGTPVPVDVSTLPPVAVSSLPSSTHIGQRVENLVVLNLVNPTTSPIFVRCHDDGTRDATEFTVPTGSKLVVTDVDWVVTADQLLQFATLRLFVENTTTPSSRCLVFLRSGPTTNVFNGSGSSSPCFGSTGLLAGFVVGSNARVVADLRTPSEAVNAGTSLAAFSSLNATVVLRGYLISAP